MKTQGTNLDSSLSVRVIPRKEKQVQPKTLRCEREGGV